MNDMEWAVRVAKAELECERLREQLDSAYAAMRNIQNGTGFTLFGHPPEFWLNLRHEMAAIANENFTDDDAMTASITDRPIASVAAARALRWTPEKETAQETAHDTAETTP